MYIWKLKSLPFLYLLCSLMITFLYAEDLSTLRFVNVLFRHGDRSPTHSYKNDLHNVSSWPQGYGQLTQLGMQQQFELGRWLRRRYEGFISQAYDRKELLVVATNYDRTIQSAQCNLAGLYYPPAPSQSHWTGPGDYINDWISVPIFGYVDDKNHDPFAGDRKNMNCPKAEELRRRDFDTDPYAAQINAENEEFYKQLSNLTGEPVHNFEDFHHVYDVLFCERAHNLSTPEWSRNVTWWRRMTFLSDVSFRYLCLSVDACRLYSGELMKSMVSNLDNITHSKPTDPYPANRRMMIYSAHDSTQAMFLSSLRVFNNRKPPYTSAVLMELHHIDGVYVVKLLFKNGTEVDVPHELHIPGCPSILCPYDTFLQVTANIIPTDWRAECGIHVLDASDGTLVSISVAGALLVLALLVAVVCLAVRLCGGHQGATRGRYSNHLQLEPGGGTALQDTRYTILENMGDEVDVDGS